MVEVWKDIEGYEGLYQVSNLGRVKSLHRLDRLGRPVQEKILKQKISNCGYHRVGLYKGKKQKWYHVHRLVAMAFVDGYEEGLVVNHIDEDKTNNVWTNLEWVTTAYNNIYNDRHKRAGEKMKGRKKLKNIKRN